MNSIHQEIQVIQEAEDGRPAGPKQKNVIHFVSGETLEVEDSEEEEKEEEEESSKRSPFQEPSERTKFSFRKAAFRVGRISLLVCDFLGERVAGALGLNSAKYQYAIDQYHREQKGTSSGTAEGPPEVIHLSSRAYGCQYGATGNISGSVTLNELDDTKEGRHNRGYEADGDYLK